MQYMQYLLFWIQWTAIGFDESVVRAESFLDVFTFSLKLYTKYKVNKRTMNRACQSTEYICLNWCSKIFILLLKVSRTSCFWFLCTSLLVLLIKLRIQVAEGAVLRGCSKNVSEKTLSLAIQCLICLRNNSGKTLSDKYVATNTRVTRSGQILTQYIKYDIPEDDLHMDKVIGI